ncbi:hypothetical protein POL68_02010 [Stigmatella sp. ncwal1]|uniref:Lipoprotein n=1 Tax=Stigmatella ashevillensis TaxID=2995309 RepID=A0ABT5D0P3_9BACT|nr:hypothetical protein [Stigmatella ashevillena]MDC0707234.1 hypothetical protein [Stigmatella ashevillena]
MSERFGVVAAAVAMLASQAGCYHTSIVTDRAPESRQYSDRQWFTIAGVVPLSSPAGRECRNGLARAESEMSGADWLINIGLGVAGAVAGAAICRNESDSRQTSCATSGAAVMSFLLGSRTVEYTCARGSSEDSAPQDYAPPSSPQSSAPPPADAPQSSPAPSTP